MPILATPDSTSIPSAKPKHPGGRPRHDSPDFKPLSPIQKRIKKLEKLAKESDDTGEKARIEFMLARLETKHEVSASSIQFTVQVHPDCPSCGFKHIVKTIDPPANLDPVSPAI